MTWDDLTLKDFEELQNLYNTDKTRFANNAIQYLFNIKNADTTLPLAEYAKYLGEISFFQTQPPKANLKTEYTINGNLYKLNLDIQQFSVVQFQDFTAYNKQANPSMIDLLSVVLVPSGRLYNDGYDLEAVKDEISTMKVCDANAIVFFFAKWFQRYVAFLNACLLRKKKMMKKLPKQVQAQIQQMVNSLQQIVENMV